MEKGKPTISREPAATMGQDKPVPSMRGALVLIFIILALLLAIYILSLLSSGTSNPSPNQQPQQQKWEPSPLVMQYDKGNITPIIVINCKYVLTGSFALDEEKELVPAGSERDNIGNALCAATHKDVFCSKFSGTPKGFTMTGFQDCSSGGKTLIYAFHSPSCLISSAQRDVLDAFRDEFQGDVDIEYICTPKNDTAIQDTNYFCPQQFAAGRYNQ
jgi:hypothetical protein